MCPLYGGWIAQSVEQRTENPCVGGSIPSPATTSFCGEIPICFSGVVHAITVVFSSFMKRSSLSALVLLLGLTSTHFASGASLAPGVRGVATRAPKEMKIDGDLAEFKGSFCTPVEYANLNLRERAAQFFYMWDETAFYAGLRTLDTK